MKESEVLANTFQAARNLTKYYFALFPEEKLHEEIFINGKKLNTAYWLAAHLVWTEHFLILQGVGNTSLDIPWLKEFEIGSTPVKKDSWPEIKVIMETMDKVHEEAMKVMKELPDEELDKENYLGYTFGGVNSKRAMITHLIRHEPMHVGQLSWLLKIYGVVTV
jgi:uncharacterized damage-inducible protein DinB